MFAFVLLSYFLVTGQRVHIYISESTYLHIREYIFTGQRVHIYMSEYIFTGQRVHKFTVTGQIIHMKQVTECIDLTERTSQYVWMS